LAQGEAGYDSRFAESSPEGAPEALSAGIGDCRVGVTREGSIAQGDRENRDTGSQSALEEATSEGEEPLAGRGGSFGKENDGFSPAEALTDLIEGGVKGGEFFS
jgi:hypothetical protein